MSYLAQVTYTGNGSTTQYSITFPFLDSTHVKAFIDGTQTTAFTLSSSTLTFNSAPANSAIIRIERQTPTDTRIVDFTDGSVLTESDLDKSADQNFFIAQEISDDSQSKLGLNSADRYDANNKRIINVANPVDNQDAVTKHYLENTWLSTANKTALTTVNANISAINTVNASASAITTVNANSTNINLVAGSIGSVNTVATDIAKVIAVANDLAEAVSEVETVADDLNESTSEIEVVANAITNVDLVGGSIANVNTLAGKNTELGLLGTSAVVTDLGLLGTSANVTAMGLLGVSSVISNIASVSGKVTEIGLLGTSANITNMGTLGTSTNVSNMATLAGITNLANLANAHASVTTVAGNLAGVNSFAERYRVQSGTPASNNDVGDLVFDTASNTMKVFSSGGFINAGSSVNGTADRFEYTATAGQTTFTGSDSNSNTMAYDAGFIDVYLNGVKLANADYTATNGTSVVLGTGASVNDILMVVAFGTFSLSNFSITSANDVPASLGTAGQALVVNASANALEFSNASSAEVYGFNKYYNPSTLVKTVTVQSVGGSNKYFIEGVQQDTLELYEGNTYVFNYPSAHPFKFSTTSNGSHASGSEYTTGVTHNSSTQVTIVVASGTPTLYYYCSSHSGMGGQANTPTPANNAVQYITTNQGQDNITESQYANFDDVLFSASGFVFSIGTNGNLISTI
jgi:hypothetical protein